MSTAVARTKARTYLRGFVTDGLSTTGENDPAKQEGIAAFDALADEVDAVRQDATGGLISFNTWAELAARVTTDLTSGTTGKVYGPDAGTHTDPVVGGTVDNKGMYRYSTSPAGWKRVGNLEAEDAAGYAAIAEDAAARVPGCWNGAVTDMYARQLITEIAVEGGDPSDSYVINYETLYIGSGPLYRIRFRARSVKTGADIAAWSWSKATDPLLDYAPPRVVLSNVVNGAVQPNYQGTQVVLTINWDALTYDKALTTYTTVDEAGVDPSRVFTPEDMDDFLIAPNPKEVFTVGTGGDYATLLAAFQALQYPAAYYANPISRSTFPNSDLVSWSHQVQLVVLEGHTEEIEPETISGTAMSKIKAIPYLSIVCQPGVEFYMDAAAGSPPLVEANWPIWIENGRWLQKGDGYVFHIDPGNALTFRSPTVDRMLWKHRHVFRNCETDHEGTTTTAHHFGCGASNASTLVLDGLLMTRSGTGVASAASHILIHNSDAETDPMLLHVRHVVSDDGDRPGSGLMTLTGSYTSTVRNRVIVEDTDAAQIKGSNKWVRRGALSGIPYDAALNP